MNSCEQNCAAPFAKSWWVAPPRLLAGCYPGDPDPRAAEIKLSALLQSGIRHIVNLQEQHEKNRSGHLFMPYAPIIERIAQANSVRIQCTRLPIQDYGVPEPRTMVLILNTIDAALEQEQPVYLHCWGGHGRTGTVVGCWLVRHGLSGSDALSRIKLLRQHDSHLCEQQAPQTPEQVQFVRTWAPHDRKLA